MKKNNLFYTFLLFSIINLFLITESKAQTFVTVAGDFQSELGCPSDWQSDCTTTDLTYNPVTGKWFGSFFIPAAGSYQFKVAIDHSWTESYPGTNLPLNVATPSQFNFLYDPVTHDVIYNIAVYNGDILLSTQAEVNAFNYSSISGNLIIKESTPGNITNLMPLSILSSVGGLLDIYGNSSLTNLNGLNNLTSVGSINIYNNSLLTNLNGLNSISSVGDLISIYGNSALTNLDGLSNIHKVDGYLTIKSNSSLPNLDGLNGLNSVGGYLNIYGNSALTNLNGLSNITSIGDFLVIAFNDSLKNLDGLKHITSVGNNLTIINNYTLMSFCGLYPLLNTGGLVGAYGVAGNLINPTQQQIIDGGPCCSDVILTSQAEVNSFGATNPTSVCGYLEISGPDITDLTPLSTLTSVGGVIGLNNNIALTSLSGLENIKSVGGGIFLQANYALVNLDGFSGITSFNGSILIQINTSLINIDGLSGITGSVTSLTLRANPLENLNGLSGITSVSGDFYFDGSKTTNLYGLRNITSVGGNLTIKGNSLLNGFCGIYPLLNNNGLVGTYTVTGNAFNPTIQQIINEGPCSQPHTISYEVTLPDCENAPNTFAITGGSFIEGESFVFPPYTLPAQYSYYQPYYDALVGAELGIPVGSLNEDIHFVINLAGICNGGQVENLNTEGIYKLFFLSVEIDGASTGAHNPLEYYYFNDGKEAWLKIPLSNIAPLSDLLGFDTDQLTPFFTTNGLNPDFNGIRKENDGTYFWIYVKHFSEVNLGIITTPTDINGITNSIPTDYNLEQNYPNPFNPSTQISYSIPKASYVTLTIYDVLGNAVSFLENGNKSAGRYSYNFDASNLTSGIYFYTIKAGNFTSTKKMLLMK